MDKKTRPIYLLSPRHTTQFERYTQTENKGMGKDILQMEKKKKLGLQYLYSTK